jgi:hypothetical protein
VTPESGNADARRRKLFHLADLVGLSREERIELAQIMLRRDITSWKQLDDDQIVRMLDALEGYEKVKFLLESR